ncbi:MAG: hypothetical protein JW837_13605 [Sedimentisphaerales bacterium]|nr:hypothetical protein [Sedimentisphaerales bacterium]
MKRFFYGTIIISALITTFCLAAPEPAIVPATGQWTVDTEFTHLQQIVLQRASDKKPVRFWYTIITLTNNTDEDVAFFPKCDLMTDTFHVTQAGKGVSPVVFEQVKRRHNARYPFLELLSESGNRILQGEDNTKDIAVIWPDFDVKAKSVKLFIAGLSNETVVIKHPVAKNEFGNPLNVFLRKTLELSYDFKGDPAIRSGASLTYKGKRWIMR